MMSNLFVYLIMENSYETPVVEVVEVEVEKGFAGSNESIGEDFDHDIEQ